MPRCPSSHRLEMRAHCCHQKEHTTEAINETHHLPEESVATRIFPIVSWIHANTCASAMSCVACPIISCWTNSKEQLPWRYRRPTANEPHKKLHPERYRAFMLLRIKPWIRMAAEISILSLLNTRVNVNLHGRLLSFCVMCRGLL